jgi:hypothetical protein
VSCEYGLAFLMMCPIMSRDCVGLHPEYQDACILNIRIQVTTRFSVGIRICGSKTMSDQEILAAPALRGARPRRPEAPPEENELFEPPRTPHFLENCVKIAVHKACFMRSLGDSPRARLSLMLDKGKVNTLANARTQHSPFSAAPTTLSDE